MWQTHISHSLAGQYVGGGHNVIHRVADPKLKEIKEKNNFESYGYILIYIYIYI